MRITTFLMLIFILSLHRELAGWGDEALYVVTLVTCGLILLVDYFVRKDK